MGFLMSEETVNKCCECEEIVDTESDFGWSTVKEDYLCWGCYESDQNYASTLHVIDDGCDAQMAACRRVTVMEWDACCR